jgi:hypothetical protein
LFFTVWEASCLFVQRLFWEPSRLVQNVVTFLTYIRKIQTVQQ